MTIIISVFIISLIPLFLRLPVFETIFALLLTTPVLAFLAGTYSGQISGGTYLGCFLLLAFLLTLAFYFKEKREGFNVLNEFMPVIIFSVFFFIFEYFCNLWPDYIAMGERLRDYALLSSVIQSPIELKEPWFAGASLNYYAFWYRFGHFLSAVFHQQVWQVYNSLQSLTFALYLTTAFQLMFRHLNYSFKKSIFFAVVITIGSNLAGIENFFTGNNSWWGPSRVITGAINEFPAWSFLLGDLHPHYLNLCLLPFFALLLLTFIDKVKGVVDCLTIFLAAFLLCPLWIRNSNAWDVPAWLLLAGIIAFYQCFLLAKKFVVNKEKPALIAGFTATNIGFLILVVVLSASLYISQKNIITPSYPVDLVKSPIERTSILELSKHFGIPLILIAASTLLLIEGSLLKASAVLMLFSCIFFKQALPLLVILFFVNIARNLYAYRLFNKSDTEIGYATLVIESIGVMSLGLLIIPELIFLNDPYGADIERMNTIFKIYSVNWFFITIFAFYALSLALENVKFRHDRKVFFIVSVLFLIYSTGFFFRTAFKERKIVNAVIEPREEGLSEINKIFPGSAAAIKKLKSLPGGIVIEAQGKPYDYTSHVSTLSEKPAFLGWANHVGLLLGNHGEVQAREKITEEFYNSKDCTVKSGILKNNNIKYAVFGPLEKARYKLAEAQDFNCLKNVISEKEYRIFELD